MDFLSNSQVTRDWIVGGTKEGFPEWTSHGIKKKLIKNTLISGGIPEGIFFVRRIPDKFLKKLKKTLVQKITKDLNWDFKKFIFVRAKIINKNC